MDRRELEIMLNDAFDRGIVTARAVEGIYPPAVTVGILDDLGREIDFGHEGSGLTVFLPGIEDDARFAGSCKALGGKVPQNTYRMELVSAIAGELMGAGDRHRAQRPGIRPGPREAKGLLRVRPRHP